jgi:hypothetical protein
MEGCVHLVCVKEPRARDIWWYIDAALVDRRASMFCSVSIDVHVNHKRVRFQDGKKDPDLESNVLENLQVLVVDVRFLSSTIWHQVEWHLSKIDFVCYEYYGENMLLGRNEFAVRIVFLYGHVSRARLFYMHMPWIFAVNSIY